MFNLFEIMQAAQGGNAVNNLSRQFGLSQDQTQNALEALLPAFSMGLQQQAQSVDNLSKLAGMMTNPSTASAWDADGDGIPDFLQQQGNQVLGQLFGSKDVSRAVADQASAFSGVSSSVLKAMLPVVASMLMGGLSRSASNQGLGDILGQLAGGMMGGGQQGQASNPLGGLIGAMFGGGQQGAGANPMGGLMGAVLGGMMGQQGQAPAQNANFDPAGVGLEALTKMFDTGRNVQEQHQANLQNIFDAFLKR
jgi:hypothetical protein